ncbi:MAG: sugar ABC transporter permease, partial [Clostridia bacterium]|nr:sugar ABC transporter permease [Clostridia bacterium]
MKRVRANGTAKRYRRLTIKENIRGWGVIGPIILYYFIFGIIPLFIVVRYSFFREEGFWHTLTFRGL